MKKVKYLLGIAFGYIVTGITKVFGQWWESPQPPYDYEPMVVMGLPSPPSPVPIYKIYKVITPFLTNVVSVIVAIIGVYVFLKKTTKKEPPMSKRKKTLISIAIFFWTLIISWFFLSFIARLLYNFIIPT